MVRAQRKDAGRFAHRPGPRERIASKARYRKLDVSAANRKETARFEGDRFRRVVFLLSRLDELDDFGCRGVKFIDLPGLARTTLSGFATGSPDPTRHMAWAMNTLRDGAGP